MTDAEDTIFAVATGARRAAISVIRVSGSRAPAVLERLAGRLPPPREAVLARLRDPATNETLDHALILRFEAARSETGEDGAEFHTHGSPAVTNALMAVLAREPGLRPAEPGEFARRAFLNGKVDLTQLEALADLIAAETDQQRRQAQRQLSGSLRHAVEELRAALIESSASIEAAIDFADEVHLPELARELDGTLAPVRARLAQALHQARGAERIRDGLHVVIAGPPNAGKSSLLNAIARRDAAIVSTVAGTTRDPVEVRLDLDGYAVTLVDTAGLRDTVEPVETIGIERARARIDDADLVLWLDPDEGATDVVDVPLWRIRTKSDLRAPSTEEAPGTLALSTATGHHVEELVRRLTTFAHTTTSGSGAALLTRQRHRQCFADALAALERATASDLAVELRAEELRRALFYLDRLIGKVDVEDVLGSIFSRFCIGK